MAPSASWVLRWNTADDSKPRVCMSDGSGPARTCYVEDERGSFVAFDGYLFDRAPARNGQRIPDPQLVASAYDRWKDRLFEKLSGGFAVAIWNQEQARLSVGRDALGLNPCFYSWNGRLFIMSTSLDALLDQPELDDTFNRVVVAEYLQNSVPQQQTGETFYADARRLPPAHVLVLRGRTLIVSRYWDPVPPGFAWATPDEIAAFEPTLERAVGRCLSVGADSLALSGGFDSVSLATLAAEQLRGRTPLHAVSLRFTGTPCDEGDTQTEVARALGMPQLVQTIDESLGGRTCAEAALALSDTSPSPVLSPWQAVYTGLLQAATRLGLMRMLLGTGGDDLFNVDLAYGADRLGALDLRGLWRFYRAHQRSSPFSAAQIARVVLWEGAVEPEAKRMARAMLDRITPRGRDWLIRRRRQRTIPSWLAPADRDLSGLLLERRLTPIPIEQAPGERSYVRAIRYLTQAPLLMLELDQGHAWTQQLGLTFLFPYFDRDLVQLSLRMHPDHLMARGHAKAPLRQLVAERLPAVSMRAKKVDFTQMVHDVLRRGGQQAWRRLGGPTVLADLGILDSGQTSRLMDEYFAGRSANWSRTWRVLSTEMWLRARARRRLALRNEEVLHESA
jgi:asparagine synthase (glutamine-hydrolysing)